MSMAEPFRLSRKPAGIREALVGLLSAHEIESVSDIFCVDGDRIWMDRGRPVHHTMLPVVCAIASQLTATLESDTHKHWSGTFPFALERLPNLDNMGKSILAELAGRPV